MADQLNMRIEPARKERWTSAVNENTSYENLSHLIKLSVERELQGEHDSPTQLTSESGALSEDLGEVLSSLNRIERTIENMDSRLNVLERESETEGPSYNFEKAVLTALPTKPDENTTKTVSQWADTVDDVSSKLGADNPEQVRETLEQLADKMGLVGKIPGDPMGAGGEDRGRSQPHYYKKQ